VLATARGGPPAVELAARFAAVPGVRGAVAFSTVSAVVPGRPPTILTVAGCTALRQLRECRRLLAVLVAFGTRRSTLGWSVLWQAAVPVVLGLVLAVVVGVGLGAVLLAMVQGPVGFSWGSIAGMAGAGAGVVLSVTALSLPPLWRLMRPDGLRTE
jgi:predicted lysophospholipase L1 biosynthesis ABC-type transport system permease subunit